MALRLILGGISLATVGYGLYRYCDEEGCFDSATHETSSPSSQQDMDEQLHACKLALYEEALTPFYAVYKKLVNTEVKEFAHETPAFQELSYGFYEDYSGYEELADLLETAEHAIEQKRQRLELLGKSEDNSR